MTLNILEHVRALIRGGLQIDDAVDRTATAFNLGGNQRVDLYFSFL